MSAFPLQKTVRSAADWDTIEIEVFQPVDYQQHSGPNLEPWQSENYQPEEDSDLFLPDPYLSNINYLETSNPIQERSPHPHSDLAAAAYHLQQEEHPHSP
jgi:hypothetical protein